MIPERRRLTSALLLSLLIHAWLLSLTFGGQGWWLPGFGFLWQDRRIEVPDLRVVLDPAQVTPAAPAVTPVPEPKQQAWIDQPVVSRMRPTPSAPRAPTRQRTAAAIVPKPDPKAEPNPRTDAATGAAPAQIPWRADRPGDKAPRSIPAPAVIAVAPTDEATWVVPAAPAMPSPLIAAAPSASSPETPMPSRRDAGDAPRARVDQVASERAVELAKPDPSKHEEQREPEQLEATPRDAARHESAQVENARPEAERQDTEREATQLQEAARAESARVEAARVEAERAEAARVEAARVEAARVEAARVEAARVEAARVEAERVEAARVEAERAEAARVEAHA